VFAVATGRASARRRFRRLPGRLREAPAAEARALDHGRRPGLAGGGLRGELPRPLDTRGSEAVRRGERRWGPTPLVSERGSPA